MSYLGRRVGLTLLALASTLTGVVALSPATVATAAAAATVGTVSASPTTGLGWRNNVTVTITGAPALTPLRILECYWDVQPDGGCSTIGTPTTDGAGAANATVITRRSVHDEEGGGDCWSPQALSCDLEVFAPDVGRIGVPITITFNTSTPPPAPPSIAVEPTTGLPFESLLSVHLDGLLAYGSVELQDCTSEFTTRCVSAGSGEADGNGLLDTEFHARRLIGGFPFDCAAGSALCFVRVSSEGPNVEKVPLSFDPNAPQPPRPTIDASPTRDLVEGQAVDITGTGFTASNTVAAAVCVAGVVGTGDCDTQHFGLVSTGAGGSIALTLNVHPVIATAGGLAVDCRRASGACVLAVATFSDLSQTAVVPLTFAPAGPDPTVSIGSVAVPEGTGGFNLVQVQVPITLSAPSESSVVVVVATRDRSATAPADYVAVPGQTVVIPPGFTHASAYVLVAPDALDEPNERFVLTAQSVAGATIGDGTGSVRIVDDDPAPQVTVDDALVVESGGAATVTVRLSAPSGRSVRVDYVTHRGTAHAGRDYRSTRGHVSFAPGATVQTIRIPIVDDHVHEALETFLVHLENARHARIADADATIWIGDDD